MVCANCTDDSVELDLMRIHSSHQIPANKMTNALEGRSLAKREIGRHGKVVDTIEWIFFVSECESKPNLVCFNYIRTCLQTRLKKAA